MTRSARQALRLVGPQRRWKWPLLVVLALVVTGLEAAGALLIYALIGLVTATDDAVTLPLIGDLTAVFSDVPLRTLQIWAAVLVTMFFLARALVLVAQAYVQARVVHNAGAQIAVRLVRGYLAMPYLFHTRRDSAELVRNAFDSTQRFVQQVLMPLVRLMAEGILVIGLTVVLIVVAPFATLLAIGALGPAMWLLLRVVQPRLKQLGRESQDARSGSIHALQQSLDGFRDIRLLRREGSFVRAFAGERLRLARSDYLNRTLAELPRALIETSLVVIIVAVFLIALLSGQGVETVVSTLGVFAYVGLRLHPSLQKLVKSMNDLRFGSAVVDDLLADHDRVARVRDEEARRRQEPDASTQFHSAVELRGVTFAYDVGSSPALTGVDLTIRRGEALGICGPTGGGKSTLIDVLVGLLEPTSGQVLVDGLELRGREAWWQAQLGVVSQDVFLLNDTLRRNIAFARLDEETDEAALERAIERAQLAEVVRALPAGLETEVGERGVRLSGGQRQRVAIARALYREPAVIVFDEGTSALDSATEAALVSALEGLREGRTMITVAHRISTVRDADRIVVVESGRIAEVGTFDELMGASALFRSLAR